MNPHTPPSPPRRLRLIGKLPCATFLFALCMLVAITPAAAQNGGRDRAQAVLHIQAQVVPVTYTTSPRTSTSSLDNANANASGVTYSLPARPQAMTVIEEVHTASRRDFVAWFGDCAVETAVLKTVTIVPQ